MSQPARRAQETRELLIDLLEEANGLARGPARGAYAELRARWLGSGGDRPILPILLFGWNLHAPVVFMESELDPARAEFAPRLLRGGRAADAIDPYLCYCAERFDRTRRHGLLGTSGASGRWEPCRPWNAAEALLREWLGAKARLGREGLWLHRMPYALSSPEAADAVPPASRGGRAAPPEPTAIAAEVARHAWDFLDIVRPALVVEVEDEPETWLVRQRQASEVGRSRSLDAAYPVLGRLGDDAARREAALVVHCLHRASRQPVPLFRSPTGTRSEDAALARHARGTRAAEAGRREGREAGFGNAAN